MKPFMIMCMVLMSCLNAYAEDNISSGASGGTYNTVATNIITVCPDLGLGVTTSNGSLSNISKAFSDPNTIFFETQLDALMTKGKQEKAKMTKIVIVLPLFGEEIHLVARKGINSMNDLSNMKVVVGLENSGTWVTVKFIELLTGIKFKEYYADPKVSMKALMDGTVDAVFYVSGKPIKALIDVGKDGEDKIHLVNIKHPALDSVYSITDIPEGLYPWEPKAVQTYAVKSVLATYNYASEKRQNQVRDLVTCIKNKLPELQESGHPKWRDVDLESYKDIKWPMHSGAKAVLEGR